MNLIPESINGLNPYAVYACGLCQKTLKIIPKPTDLYGDRKIFACNYCQYKAEYYYWTTGENANKYSISYISFPTFIIWRQNNKYCLYFRTEEDAERGRFPNLILNDLSVNYFRDAEKLALL